VLRLLLHVPAHERLHAGLLLGLLLLPVLGQSGRLRRSRLVWAPERL
jgi:hypothetical protein